MAIANAYSGTKITTATLQPNGSNLYDYTSVKMYSFPTVANNFSGVQNDIRTLITTQITPSTYLDIPTSTTLTDASAQGQQTGNLSYTVPVDAPDSMFYGDSDWKSVRNGYSYTTISNWCWCIQQYFKHRKFNTEWC